jgi:Family of unknown function (DUF6236)
LYRSIPVPDKDVSLADVLEFKERRRPELLHLRTEIDELYTKIERAEDKGSELARCTSRIESACVDLLKVTKDSLIPFKITNLKVSFELKRDALIGSALGMLSMQTLGMPLVGAFLGGVAGSLKVSGDIGLKGRHSDNPYWYVARFHKEVFGDS